MDLTHEDAGAVRSETTDGTSVADDLPVAWDEFSIAGDVARAAEEATAAAEGTSTRLPDDGTGSATVASTSAAGPITAPPAPAVTHSTQPPRPSGAATVNRAREDRFPASSPSLVIVLTQQFASEIRTLTSFGYRKRDAGAETDILEELAVIESSKRLLYRKAAVAGLMLIALVAAVAFFASSVMTRPASPEPLTAAEKVARSQMLAEQPQALPTRSEAEAPIASADPTGDLAAAAAAVATPEIAKKEVAELPKRKASKRAQRRAQVD